MKDNFKTRKTIAENYKNPKPQTLEKYIKVAEAWLTNGYDAIAAYQSVYPNASRRTASDNFSKIRSCPPIASYIAEQRKIAFDSRCIDLQRVIEELSKVAFSKIDDPNIPASTKVKSLEILLKTLKEDAAATEEEQIVVELDEDSTEE